MERMRIKIKDTSKLEEHGFLFRKDEMKWRGRDQSYWAYASMSVNLRGFVSIASIKGETMRKFAELAKADLIEFTRDGDGKVRVEMTKEEYERWRNYEAGQF